jgi:hypothetical protein
MYDNAERAKTILKNAGRAPNFVLGDQGEEEQHPRSLGRTAHDKTVHSISLHVERGSPGGPAVDRAVDGEEAPMAPAGSLARMRKQVLDRVARKDPCLHDVTETISTTSSVGPHSAGVSSPLEN